MASCVLCGATIGRNSHSRQHVFPEWLEKYFVPEDMGKVPVPHRRKLKRRGDPTTHEEWEDVPFNMRIKDMCKPCNNEWCNGIENDAQPPLVPMVTGNRITLDTAGQAAVATQAMLIALILQLTHAEGERSIEQEAFRWFRRWRQPLPNEQLWIALYDGAGEWPTSYRHYGMTIFDSAIPDPPEDLNAHGLAFTIGHLVVVAFGHTIEHELRVGVQSGAPSEVLRPIWPAADSPLTFPGRGYVAGSGGLDSLVDSFGDAAAFNADRPQNAVRRLAMGNHD